VFVPPLHFDTETTIHKMRGANAGVVGEHTKLTGLARTVCMLCI